MQISDAGLAADAAGAAGQEVAANHQQLKAGAQCSRRRCCRSARRPRGRGRAGYRRSPDGGGASAAEPMMLSLTANAGCQVDVVAGRAHREADSLTADSDAERLLGRQQVGALARGRGAAASPAWSAPVTRVISTCVSFVRPWPLPACCLLRYAYPGLPLAATSVLIGRCRRDPWLDRELASLPSGDRTGSPGRGDAVRSPHTEAAAPRTQAADRVVGSVCRSCAVGCGRASTSAP